MTLVDTDPPSGRWLLCPWAWSGKTGGPLTQQNDVVETLEAHSAKQVVMRRPSDNEMISKPWTAEITDFLPPSAEDKRPQDFSLGGGDLTYYAMR